MSRNLSRRSLLLGGSAALGLGAVGLSACSGGVGGGGAIRFAWYGGAERQNAYMELLELFEEEHDDAVVEPEYADYEPYQDRLATQFAANDGPDLFFLAGFNVLEFETSGIYHDLAEFVPDIIDLSDMDPQLVEDWHINGQLTAMPYAYWTSVIRSNRDFLEEAGMELPDDETWTWDDFVDLSQEYSDATDDGMWGTAYQAHADLPFNSFLRQAGQELFTMDGEVGFDADAMGEWMAMWEEMVASGAAMPVQAQEGVTPDWDLIAPRVMFNPGNANHHANDQPAVDWELDLHLCPTLPDSATGHRYLHLVRFAMYEQTNDPELSAHLMNFLLNSEHVPPLIGQNQGLPTSERLQQLARDNADENGKKVIDIIEREAAMEMRPRPEVPPGAAGWRDMMARAIEAISIEGASIQSESERFVNDLTAEVDRAAG